MPTTPALYWFPVLVQLVLAAVIAAALVSRSYLLGKRVKDRVKDQPYECGMTPVGDARERFSVKFYLVAMLFILFDIEAIFLYPWAVIYKTFENKMFAFSEMLLFIVLIVAGFFFIWKKGVLDWSSDRAVQSVRKS
jgi:NADH-quinone oxidoreductase subunit A